MTLHRWQRQKNDFAPLHSFVHEPVTALTSPHDDDSQPSSVTTLTLSHEWRRILAAILDPMLERAFWIGTDSDIDTAIQNAYLLLEDLDFGLLTGGTMSIGAKIRRDTDYSIASDTETVIPFVDPDTLSDCYDDLSFWDSANPSRLTIPNGEGGRYVVYGGARFGTGGSGNRRLSLLRNGTDEFAQGRLNDSARFAMSIAQIINLSDGDYIELRVYSQSSVDIEAQLFSPVMAVQKQN